MMNTQWIKRVSYNDGGRIAAGFKSSAGDCVVRAFTILTGMSYMQMREVVLTFIERERGSDRSSLDDGVYPKTYAKILKHLNAKKLTRIDSWNKIPTTGKFFVVTEDHAVAYIDGVFNDTFDPTCEKSSGKLIGYYEI